MKRRLAFLAAFTVALGCCAPEPPIAGSPGAPPTTELAIAPAAATTAATDAVDLFQGGIPALGSVADAIAYATQEANLHAYSGIVFGSEHFPVELPSGQSVSNWRVNCFYGAVFRPFGTEAHAAVVPLLAHEDLFVQVGAAAVLGPALFDAGYAFRLADTEEQRLATVDGVLRYLEGLGSGDR